jgi:hypothetical protein
VARRAKKFLRVAYDGAEFIPLLPNNHPLSWLYLEEAHRTDHGWTDAMVMRNHAQVWIVRARKLAKRLKKNCFTWKELPRRGRYRKWHQ